MAWEWVAPITTGILAITTIGVTTVQERTRRRREDRIRSDEEERRQAEVQREAILEVMRMLDIVDAVTREHYQDDVDKNTPVPGSKLAWSVADLLRANTRVRERELRQRVDDTAELVRLHNYVRTGSLPPSVTIYAATQEAREALGARLRDTALPPTSPIFLAQLNAAREQRAAQALAASGAAPSAELQLEAALHRFTPEAVAAWLRPWMAQQS